MSFVPRFLRRIAVTATFAGSLPVVHAEILSPPNVTDSAPEYSGQYSVYNLFDNDATDYASLGSGVDTFLEFQFPAPETFDGIVVVNRDSPAGGDWIGDFTLTFDDGPTAQILRPAERGVGKIEPLGSITAQKIRLDVDATGPGGPTNTGAMEIFFLRTPTGSTPVDSVAVTGSATPFNAEYAAAGAADGIVGRSSGAGVKPEYASKSLGIDAFVDFDLGAILPVTGFDLFDRFAAADRVTAFDLIFSQNAVFGDGDDVIQNYDNSSFAIGVSATFPPVNARYLRYDVTATGSSATANAGLSEIVFYKAGGAAAVAPQIVAAPAAVTRFAGENHTFTVSASGSAPLSYQWKKGGSAIPGEMGVSLKLANLQASDGADYSVTVSNSVSSVTSAAAKLTVDVTPGNPAAGQMVALKFDETAGLVAADSAGDDDPGTLENFTGGNLQWQPGLRNGAISLNPAGQEGNVVTVEDRGNLDFSGTGIFSASCWVKAPAGLAQVPGAAILCKGTGGGGEQFCLDIFGGGYRFYMYDDAVPANVFGISSNVRPNGEWQHLAIVFDRDQQRMQLYVNGAVVGSAQPAATILPESGPVSVGSRKSNGLPETPYDLSFQGLIDDLVIYNRVLSPADILAVSPFIQTPPIGSRIFGGDSYTFVVTAAGAGPVSYQWTKNGAVLPGETGATLTIGIAGAGDTADYSVTLTNPAGSITSSPARLTVEGGVPDVERGLLAHLKFDETTGLVAADASGQGNAGALENFIDDDSQWQAGRTGGAAAFSLAFPDSTEVVNIPDTGKLDFTANGTFSASCWVKASPDAVQKNGAGIVCKGGGGGGEEFCLDLLTAGYRFYVWNGGNPNVPTVLQTNIVPTGEWQNLTAVFNQASGRMKLYVDGLESGSVAPPATLLFNADPISIGARTPSTSSLDYTLNFQGVIDEVRIYDRDISPSEITLLANPVPSVNAPVLSITRNDANVEISWPTDVTGWVLEESLSLAAQSWTVSAGVVNNHLTVPAPAGRKFYRLRQ